MLDRWSPNEGDTHLMADYRELLEDHQCSMSDDQSQRMRALDARAKEMLDGYQGEVTWDVAMLKVTVSYWEP